MKDAFYGKREFRRRVLIIDTQADVGCALTLAQLIMRYYLIRETVQVQKQNAYVPAAYLIQQIVMLLIVSQRFLFYLLCNSFDLPAIESPFIAESHPMPLHRLLWPEKPLHIT